MKTATAIFTRKPATLAEVQDVLSNIKAMEKRLNVKHGTTPYCIALEKHLTAAEWQAFTGDLLADRDWIAAFSEQDGPSCGDALPCIRVTGEGSPLALIVNPEGYTYARYVAIEGQ